MLDAAETLAITVSVTTAALLRFERTKLPQPPGAPFTVADDLLSQLRSSYLNKGAMFGTWTSFLEAVARKGAGLTHAPSALREFLRGAHGSHTAIGSLHNLRNERNRASHGDRPRSEEEAALRVSEHLPFLRSALEIFQPLQQLPWLYIASTAYSPKFGTFDVTALHVMGDHPDFERRRFTWSQPVGNGLFYVLTPEGALPLSPFVSRPFCQQCMQLEICYTYRVAKQNDSAQSKSFDRGHEILVDDLGAEIRDLPDKRGA
ncbi:hypothetical protein [Streptomyces hoynatensis]|uniref:hypothetical protein n=1 Tax=Streptomyces hoynatensis TaxID=1141874 RepID=UPI00131A1EC9|nr:hypothetical protein [Streptomyces hoynatensis]